MERYGIGFSLVSNIECAEFDHKGRRIPAFLQKSQNSVLKSTVGFARRNPDKTGVLAWLKINSELPDKEFVSVLRENRDVI